MANYPQLQGLVDDKVVRAIRQLFDNVYSLKGSVEDLQGQLKASTRTNMENEGPNTGDKGLNLTLNAPVQLTSGFGSPENVVLGNVGDLYLRQDGGAGTTLYIKESGNATRDGWMGY